MAAHPRMTLYLDYQATTPLAPEAYAAMRPWLEEKFANPHSPHKMGREAAAVVELARAQIGALLPKGGKLYFTSGATEALNWALRCAGDCGNRTCRGARYSPLAGQLWPRADGNAGQRSRLG